MIWFAITQKCVYNDECDQTDTLKVSRTASTKTVSLVYFVFEVQNYMPVHFKFVNFFLSEFLYVIYPSTSKFLFL